MNTNLPAHQPIAVFDLDGTLIDTAADLTRALTFALAEHRHGHFDPNSLRDYAGTGGRGMLAYWSKLNGIELAEHDIETVYATFLKHYQSNMPGYSAPYPGALKFVQDLRARGWKTAICTNKPQALAVKLIDALGLSDAFDALCGADFFDVRKPDPRHLTGTINEAGGDAKAAVMFGDSENDVLVAQRASIPVIAFDFGYSPQPVVNFKPTLLVSSYGSLNHELLEQMLFQHHSA
jgi:phosphoglycolate phosphatase